MNGHSLRFGFLALLVIIVLSGCGTIQVSMSPLISNAELGGRSIPARVGLLMDSEFANLHWHGFTGAEMAKLDYDLGSASRDILRDTLTRVATGVELVEKRPPYAANGQHDLALVVEPHFVQFAEGHSLWIRNGDFTAHLEYQVIVYDKRGNVLSDRIYKADARQRGSMDPRESLGSRYGAPAGLALEKIVLMIVDDLAGIKIPEL